MCAFASPVKFPDAPVGSQNACGVADGNGAGGGAGAGTGAAACLGGDLRTIGVFDFVFLVAFLVATFPVVRAFVFARLFTRARALLVGFERFLV